MKTTRKIIVIVACVMFAFTTFLMGLSLNGIITLSKVDTEAFTTYPSSSVLSIGEIWDSSSQSFNLTNLNTMLQKMTGDSSTNINNLAKIEELDKNNVKLTENIRNKNSGKDMVVKIGGLKWTPVYLDNSDYSDGYFVMFWLADSAQIAKASYGAGNFDDYGRAKWNSGFNPANNTACSYPSAMYGTSYMRSVVLNNGGPYLASQGATSLTDYSQDSNSIFAPFTMAEYGLTKFMLRPYDYAKLQGEYYSWDDERLYGEFATHELGLSYNLSNEGYKHLGASQKIEGYYSADYNYAYKQMYDGWQFDYLWLPSLSEVGYSSTVNGFCRASDNQRKSTYSTWLRSASYNDASKACTLGASSSYSTSAVNNLACVRPAFMLGLTHIAEYLSKDSSFANVDEIWNSEVKAFDKTNLNKLLQMVSGSDSSSIEALSTIESKANAKTTAENFRGFTTGGKSSGKDILVKFGGLYWTPVYLSKDSNNNPILTLWLWDSVQIAGGYLREGVTFDDCGGSVFSEWYTSSSAVDYPCNMYGTSYMRAVVLNNGGKYSTSSSELTDATQYDKNVFAPFTMDKFGINQYLVTPEYVEWQKSGQSAVTQFDWTGWSPNSITNKTGDNWSTDISPSNYYYAGKEGFSTWKDDTIWLTSSTETGVSDKMIGIWHTSVTQRKNACWTWQRSACGGGANSADYAYVMLILGETGTWGLDGCAVDRFGKSAPRPALHLNLKTASESAKSVLVTLNNQGADKKGTESVSVGKGQPMPPITIPEKTGYTFGGYFTGTSGSGTKYYNADGTSAKNCDFTTDKTLYAKWEANKYTVTLDWQDGLSTTTSVEMTYDSTPPNITAPTRNGYTFAGYFANSNGTGTQYYDSAGKGMGKWQKASEGTIYAHWTGITYTVHFEGNGASGTMEDVTVSYSQIVSLVNKFTWKGYIFKGWSRTATGDPEFPAIQTSTSGLTTKKGEVVTLYAIWTETWASEKNIKEPLGTGSQADPYLIAEAGNLGWMAHEGSDFSGKYFKQTEDIYLNGIEWMPIQSFNGYYNGNQHFIEGMEISHNNSTFLGFIGTVRAEIRNVLFKNAYIESYNSGSVGVLAGCILVDSTIYNVGMLDCSVYQGDGYFDELVAGRATGILTGLIRGYDEAEKIGKISNCYALGCSIVSSGSCGSLVGEAYNPPPILNCKFDVTIQGEGYANYDLIGGLIGYLEADSIPCNIVGCDISVNLTGEYCGGVIGVGKGEVYVLYSLVQYYSDYHSCIGAICSYSMLDSSYSQINLIVDNCYVNTFRNSIPTDSHLFLWEEVCGEVYSTVVFIEGDYYYSDGDFSEWGYDYETEQLLLPAYLTWYGNVANENYEVEEFLYSVGQPLYDRWGEC